MNITKILVANRGEIAVRVMKTARKLGIRTAGIYSSVDADSLHVTEADESWCIGEAELHDTYLNIDKIIRTALQAGCDAIHPGYGFLAENPLFPDACEKAGLVFIGPTGEVMRQMGNKIAARAFAKKAGVPITEGLTGDKNVLLKAKEKISFPVLLKAAAGGGGKGMRIVYDERELEEAIDATSRQAQAYFGDPTVYIEKFIEEPRHIEVQVLGDHHGKVIHLYERECSIQRRYQKIIEESPSPTLTPAVREAMGAAAVKIASAIGYTSAGTIEFLVDKELNYYFLEMNTRIQVEHPVTELVTGYDLVEEQIRIAEGSPLRIRQEEVVQRGHAIECRIYAEDPEHEFRPSPGKMTLYHPPRMNGIRIDTGITAGTEIKSNFDPMICKLITRGDDREAARLAMIDALSQYVIHGIRTNIAYLGELLKTAEFTGNRISTGYCDVHTPDIVESVREKKNAVPAHLPVIAYILADLQLRSETGETATVWNRIGYWRNRMEIALSFEEEEKKILIRRAEEPFYEFELDGQVWKVEHRSTLDGRTDFFLEGTFHSAWLSEDRTDQAYLSLDGHLFLLKRHDVLTDSVTAAGQESLAEGEHPVLAPMPGKLIKMAVEEGHTVKKGDLLLILEAMKMENRVTAPAAARVTKILVAENDRVESSATMMILEKIDES